jgi:hypothetical protein
MTLYTARIESFGYLHGAAPEATAVIDLRRALYDPHVDPAMRQLTAQDPHVLEHVANTPGARDILHGAVELANALGSHARPAGKAEAGDDEIRVHIAYGCAGGRHRSAGMAILTAEAMAAAGWRVELAHRDIHRPVVERGRDGRAAPARIQRRRTRGWHMPEGAVYVGRPTRFGNPFGVDEHGRGRAIELYRAHLANRPDLIEAARTELRGRDLACWCPSGAACHADVLLEIANKEAR